MINQMEFEKLIQQVIDGEISRKEISKQYHMATRTINSKITELAITNPKLYQDFIHKFPFRPKEITHINFVELTKKIMKEEGELGTIINLYDISIRTFHRRLREMKDSDAIDELTGLQQKEIYNLYKKYNKGELSLEDKIRIEDMKIGDIVEKERVTDRESFLEELLQQYYQFISQGLSKAEAARNLGFSYTDMYKKENELKRIKTEQKTKQQRIRDFKEEIKVSNIPNIEIEKINQGKKIIKREKGKGEI